MKSIPSVNVIRINTMRKLLSRRCDLFKERAMIERIQSDPTYNQKKVTLAALQKIIRSDYRQQYESWSRKWSPRAAQRLRYKEGCIVKLSEVNEIFSKRSLHERLDKNPQLQIVRKNICKSCKKLHKVGCCNNYSTSNRSSAMFILNGYLSK